MPLHSASIHLNGSKAYFTGFDYMYLRSKRNKEKNLLEIERTFKLLLLSKNNVICPTSHLYTPHIYEFLVKNKDILDNRLIVPALRSNVNDPAEFLENYEIGNSIKIPQHEKNDIIAYYASYAFEFVKWKDTSTMEVFKNALTDSLKNERSVLYSNFKHPDENRIKQLINTIQNSPLTNRYLLEKETHQWDSYNKRILKNYMNLIYHRIGANLIDLECSLPITSFVDYSLDKIVTSDVLLSERDLFLKLLFERLFSMIEMKPSSIEVIDALTYKDIAQIRQRLQTSDFMNGYEELISNTLHSLSTRENDLSFESVEKPIQIIQRLSNAFDEIAKEQIFVANKKKNAQYLATNQVSFLMDGIGFIPVLGNIVAATKMAFSSPNIIFNLFTLIKNRKQLHSTAFANELKDKKIQTMINKFRIGDSTYFHDTIKLINDVSIERRKF